MDDIDTQERLLAIIQSQEKALARLEKRLAAYEQDLPPETDPEPPEPMPPTTVDRPCQYCGQIHDPKAEQLICACLDCGQIAPLVHCGYCERCTYMAIGMSLGPEVAAKAVPSVTSTQRPWEAPQ